MTTLHTENSDGSASDEPLYTPDDMNAVTFWSIVAVCVLALAAALSPVLA